MKMQFCPCYLPAVTPDTNDVWFCNEKFSRTNIQSNKIVLSQIEKSRNQKCHFDIGFSKGQKPPSISVIAPETAVSSTFIPLLMVSGKRSDQSRQGSTLCPSYITFIPEDKDISTVLAVCLFII